MYHPSFMVHWWVLVQCGTNWVLILHNGLVCNRIQLKDTFWFSYYAPSHVWWSATSIFNTLIIYHSLDSVKKPSLSLLLQAVCNFRIQQNNNLSFLRLSQGAFSLLQAVCNFNILIICHSLLRVKEPSLKEPSLSLKQCASSVFNILIFYHLLLGVKEPSLSHKQCFLF
jgi:hypothetical protein